MTTTLLDLSKQPDLALMGQLAGAILVEADALQIPIFMAGAMARDLILTYGYGINTGRATTDVDWAMQVESWEQFAAVKNALINTVGGHGEITEAEPTLKNKRARPLSAPNRTSSLLGVTIRSKRVFSHP